MSMEVQPPPPKLLPEGPDGPQQPQAASPEDLYAQEHI